MSRTALSLPVFLWRRSALRPKNAAGLPRALGAKSLGWQMIIQSKNAQAGQKILLQNPGAQQYFWHTLAAFFLLWELASNPGIFARARQGQRAKPQTLQIPYNHSISLTFACFMCYTNAMKTSIQQAAAKSLAHQAITAATAGQAQILAQAAAKINPSINAAKIQTIWFAKLAQKKGQ